MPPIVRDTHLVVAMASLGVCWATGDGMVRSEGIEGLRVVEAADRALLFDAAATVDNTQKNDTKRKRGRI